MRFKYLIFLILLSFLGCASFSGNNFDENKLSSVNINKTTKAEIIKMFGEPESRSQSNDDSEVYVYVYVKIAPFGTSESKSVAFIFKDDVVTNFNLLKSKAN